MSEFLESLPEDIRGNEHLVDIEDAGTLASKYVEAVSKPTDFASQLPEELKDNETLKDMDVGKLATSYIDIQGKIPKVPEKPDEYNFEYPEEVPFDEAAHKLFKEFALEAGLTQDQFKKFNEWDIKRIGQVMESLEAKRQETWKQIRKDTGLEETEIEQTVEEVGNALKLGPLAERLDLKADPDWVNAMLHIKKYLSEDQLKLASSGGKTRPVGPDGKHRLMFPNTPGMDGS